MKRSDNVLRLLVRLALIAIFWLAGLGILLDREHSLVLADDAVSAVAQSAAQQVRLLLELEAGGRGGAAVHKARLASDGAILVDPGGSGSTPLRIDAPSLLARVRIPAHPDQTVWLAPDQPLAEPRPLQRIWLATIGPPRITSAAPVPGTDFSVVALRARHDALFDWRQRSRSFVLLALLLAGLIEIASWSMGRRLARSDLRLALLTRASVEFFRSPSRETLCARLIGSALELAGGGKAEIVPPGRFMPKGCVDFPAYGAGGAEILRLRIMTPRWRRPGHADLGTLGELTQRAAAALEQIELMEARDRAVKDSLAARQTTERIFNAMSDAVIALDHASRITYVNPNAERLFGLPAQSLIGARPEDVLRADQAAILRAAGMQARLPDAAGAQLGVWRMDPGHAAVRVRVRAFPQEEGLTLYLQDVTRQLASEEALQQSAKMDALGRLTGGLAHDFNNMLTVVLGNLETLELYELAEEQRRLVTAATHAGENARDLVRQLLAFARRQPLAPVEFDVSALIDRVTQLLARMLSPGITVTAQGDVGGWRAVADPVQLESALLNLAVNARDAMPDGGRLSIQVAVTDGFIRIEVADTGRGIAPEILPRVFDPFFTTKGPGEGTGLGLSIVYGFAVQSGGDLRIESVPGAGTTVVLSLPAVTPARGDAAREARAAAPPLGGQGETVLLVEDEDEVRAHVGRVLSQLGYKVIASPDAETALRSAELHGAPDILLTDLVLKGGMDGRELADRLQVLLPSLPVLFMSAYPDLQVAGRLGTETEWLQKPFSRGALARRLREVINRPVESSASRTPETILPETAC